MFWCLADLDRQLGVKHSVIVWTGLRRRFRTRLSNTTFSKAAPGHRITAGHDRFSFERLISKATTLIQLKYYLIEFSTLSNWFTGRLIRDLSSLTDAADIVAKCACVWPRLSLPYHHNYFGDVSFFFFCWFISVRIVVKIMKCTFFISPVRVRAIRPNFYYYLLTNSTHQRERERYLLQLTLLQLQCHSSAKAISLLQYYTLLKCSNHHNHHRQSDDHQPTKQLLKNAI